VIFLDSNILIDVIEFDPDWEEWSSRQIEDAGKVDRLVINEIVVAEAAPRSGPLDRFEGSMEAMGISLESLSAQAAYHAGQTFQVFRQNRPDGAKRSILADFLIGGHAEVLGATILTRDPRFYRAYFPSVPLITPDKADT
jgi:predicted nucleic acid-binding protein